MAQTHKENTGSMSKQEAERMLRTSRASFHEKIIDLYSIPVEASVESGDGEVLISVHDFPFISKEEGKSPTPGHLSFSIREEEHGVYRMDMYIGDKLHIYTKELVLGGEIMGTLKKMVRSSEHGAMINMRTKSLMTVFDEKGNYVDFREGGLESPYPAGLLRADNKEVQGESLRMKRKPANRKHERKGQPRTRPAEREEQRGFQVNPGLGKDYLEKEIAFSEIETVTGIPRNRAGVALYQKRPEKTEPGKTTVGSLTEWLIRKKSKDPNENMRALNRLFKTSFKSRENMADYLRSEFGMELSLTRHSPPVRKDETKREPLKAKTDTMGNDDYIRDALDTKHIAKILGVAHNSVSALRSLGHVKEYDRRSVARRIVTVTNKSPEEKLERLNKLFEGREEFQNLETAVGIMRTKYGLDFDLQKEERPPENIGDVQVHGEEEGNKYTGNDGFLGEIISNKKIARILGTTISQVRSSRKKKSMKSAIREHVTEYVLERRDRTEEEILGMINRLYLPREEFPSLEEAVECMKSDYGLGVEMPIVRTDNEREEGTSYNNSVTKLPPTYTSRFGDPNSTINITAFLATTRVFEDDHGNPVQGSDLMRELKEYNESEDDEILKIVGRECRITRGKLFKFFYDRHKNLIFGPPDRKCLSSYLEAY